MTFEKMLTEDTSGFPGDELNEQKAKIIRVVNLLAFVTASLTVTLGPYLYFLTGHKMILYPALLETMIFLMIPLLNYRGKHLSALYLMFSAHTLAVGYFTTILGPNTNLIGFAVFLCLAAFILFEMNAILLIFYSLVILMVAFVKANYHYHFIESVYMDQNSLLNLEWTADISVLFLAGMLLYCFHFQNAQNNRWKMIMLDRLNNYVKNTTHELRGQLNIIYTISQRHFDGPEANFVKLNVKEVRAIKFACMNLKVVINNVLTWSRIEAKEKEEINNIDFALLEWIKGCESYRYTVQDKSVKFNINTSKDLPPRIMTDPDKFSKILSNLIINAVKFAIDEVTISVEVEDNELVFIIEDNGDGIPDADLATIFVPYKTKAGQSVSSTGLGLPIAKHTAELLNGTLDVETESGVGTSFIFTMPFVIPEGQIIYVEPTYYDERLKNFRLIIVDDDTMALAFLERFCRDTGIKVQGFSHPQIALDAVLENPPDMILLDYNMPLINGGEFIKVLREDHHTVNIPVIAITGKGWTEEHKAIMKEGFNEIIMKPISYPKVFNSLKKYLLEDMEIA